MALSDGSDRKKGFEFRILDRHDGKAWMDEVVPS